MDREQADLDDGCRSPRASGGAALRLPRPVRAVVFDLDGTLLDTELLYREAFDAALSELGWALPGTLYEGLIGLPGTARREMLPRLLGPRFPTTDFFEGYARHRVAALAPGIPLKPGVDEALAALGAAGLSYGIATSASRRTAHENLAAAGLLDRFEVVVTRDDVAQGKPHPDSFLHAAAGLGVPPQDCLAIEDSTPGALAAWRAGMMVVAIPDAVQPTQAMLGCCAAVLGSLHDLAALLDGHAGAGRLNDRLPVRA